MTRREFYIARRMAVGQGCAAKADSHHFSCTPYFCFTIEGLCGRVGISYTLKISRGDDADITP